MSDSVLMQLNDWCELFTDLAENSEQVYWIRSIDYCEQIYLSPGFEKVFQQPCDLLYEHPKAFSDFLVSENRSSFMKSYVSRHIQTDSDKHIIYQIKRPSGEVRTIKDNFFTLYNSDLKPSYAAGVALDITNKLNSVETKYSISDIQDQHSLNSNNFQNELYEKLKLSSEDEDEQQKLTKSLSRREKQCAYYLLKGYSAKQTAEILHLSPRTVEDYINSLKHKYACKSKLQLIQIILKLGHDKYIQQA